MKNVFSLAIVACLAFAGCASQTAFTGDAHIEAGPEGCRAKCTEWNMELAGMVAMGEYSDACICRVPGATSSLEAQTAVAVAGVMEQMRQAEEEEDD